MSKKGWITAGGALLALILLLGTGAYFVWRQNNPGSESAQAATLNLPPDKVTAEDMAMGSNNAPVTIIEYYAQACSYCAHFNETVFPAIKAKYIDTGKVRYVLRLFPLFAIDGPAYKLTRCVAPDSKDSGKYFQAVDTMFRHQPEWDNAEFKDADVRTGMAKMVSLLGLKDADAQACMNSTARDAAINKTAQEGDARYHIEGTPTVVINYKKVDLPQQTWEEADAAIQAALGGAK